MIALTGSSPDLPTKPCHRQSAYPTRITTYLRSHTLRLHRTGRTLPRRARLTSHTPLRLHQDHCNPRGLADHGTSVHGPSASEAVGPIPRGTGPRRHRVGPISRKAVAGSVRMVGLKLKAYWNRMSACRSRTSLRLSLNARVCLHRIVRAGRVGGLTAMKRITSRTRIAGWTQASLGRSNSDVL